MIGYNPWLDAAQRYPDLHIEWHPLLPAHAMWAPVERVVLVDESISTVERRCALAHEIAHIDTGDRPTDLCWFRARQETVADRLAARRLIAIEDLAEVVRWCHDPRETSAELGVTLNVLAIRAATLHPSERGLIEAVKQRRERAA